VSRFANATATTQVDLGACECTGTPHESDWARVRSELTTTEIARFAGATAETVAAEVAGFVVSWNFLDDSGRPFEPDAASILALKPPTLTLIVKAVGAAAAASSRALPNGSGALSASSSQGSASPAPTTPASH
jgi:hypothetical protein